MTTPSTADERPTLFGHPTGLFTLFFAEMWERFSYYGMRALLLFYMLKGFLGYGDRQAYAVYGAYTALVYMTPFFGGALADRLLGARRAVVLGGLLMAAGHLLMTVETEVAFFGALALLIAGNGFFKPNISTLVGSLYRSGSPKRDGGFTLFYMGINLGAAMSPLLCGYVGETYGWHYGFGLATIGMLTGLAVFVMPARVARLLVGAGALTAAASLLLLRPDNAIATATNVFVALSLLAAGVVSWVALGRGGLPAEAGAPPDHAKLRAPVFGGALGGLLDAERAVYVGTLVLLPIVALLVAGFSPLTTDGSSVVLFSESVIASLRAGGGFAQVLATILEEVSRPAGLVLTVTGLASLVYVALQLRTLAKVARERLLVVLTLMFFSMLFWSFFEQAGSSINNFTDRNVDRVTERRVVLEGDVGNVLRIQPTQEQIGYSNGDAVFALHDLDTLRAAHASEPAFELDWVVSSDDVGMRIAERRDEVPASVFQSVNPVCILLFGLVFTALWHLLGARGLEPSPPAKFALGLLQLGLGFGSIWYGAQSADARGMTSASWLVLGYLLHTTGELCLSPVGLSTVTRMSPGKLVSTMMGMWFLATAFSQYLAAIISQFTGVGEGGGAPEGALPSVTVHVYGDVFGTIAVAAIVSALACAALLPWLRRFMHEGATESAE